jgi:predicted  nucleic acid-binding Zn-ribbon protein
VVKAITSLQERQTKLESDVCQVNVTVSKITTNITDMESKLLTKIEENRTRIRDGETKGSSEICELRKEISKELETVKKELASIKQEAINGSEADKLAKATDKVSWSEIVCKEVDSKISGVSAEMKSLQQASLKMKMDRDEQEEIYKRKN